MPLRTSVASYNFVVCLRVEFSGKEIIKAINHRAINQHPMSLLESKVIFLTGGTTGIGYECAKAYCEQGALLAIVSNDEKQVQEALERLGKNHLGIVANVSIAKDVKRAIELTVDKYGRIDGIHNNAGISEPSKTIEDTNEEEWNNVVNVNLKSVFLTAKYGIEWLKKSKGCILTTSSLVGEIGQEYHAAYAATKGGINALTKSMALDCAKHHIRVNAVCPAGVWTPMLRKWSTEQSNASSIEKYLDDIHPLGYCPEGDVVADVCVFLLSNKARFITGCLMPVSGGAELGYKRIN